jgi:Zn-finger protein
VFPFFYNLGTKNRPMLTILPLIAYKPIVHPSQIMERRDSLVNLCPSQYRLSSCTKILIHSPKGFLPLLNDVPAIEAGYTHEITDIENRYKLQVKIRDKELEQNPTTYYQIWGFAFFTWVLEGKIEWRPSLNKYNIRQKNRYLPAEEITVNPTWVPNDLLTCIYTLLFIFASKKQKVCVACYCPFNPTRPNTKHCSETCSERLKKRRLRERISK